MCAPPLLPGLALESFVEIEACDEEPEPAAKGGCSRMQIPTDRFRNLFAFYEDNALIWLLGSSQG